MVKNFLNYFYLVERHDNVATSVNKNVKNIIKALVEDFKTKLKKNLTEVYGNLVTDYEYVVGGLTYLTDYAIANNREVQYVFEKIVDIKIKHYRKQVKVLITLAKECNGIHGEFNHENENLPEINIQLDFIEIKEKQDFYRYKGVIRMLQSYLAHELMHCYQYLSKNNYEVGKINQSGDKIPNSFSYIPYYLKSSEIESKLMSAFSQFKRDKKHSFFAHLMRLLDYDLSTSDNTRNDLDLTPEYLKNKYTKLNDLNDLFVFDYVLGVFLPKSRFYSLCSNDKSYRNYLKTLDIDDLKRRKIIIDKIYDLLEEKFLDENYSHIQHAFFLVGNKQSLNKLCSSTKYTSSVYQKILNENFVDDDKIYDEEEDTVVYGREKLNLNN